MWSYFNDSSALEKSLYCVAVLMGDIHSHLDFEKYRIVRTTIKYGNRHVLKCANSLFRYTFKEPVLRIKLRALNLNVGRNCLIIIIELSARPNDLKQACYVWQWCDGNLQNLASAGWSSTQGGGRQIRLHTDYTMLWFKKATPLCTSFSFNIKWHQGVVVNIETKMVKPNHNHIINRVWQAWQTAQGGWCDLV